MAKVCLIRPAAPELINDAIDPPLGLVLLATALQRQGHDVDVLDFCGNHHPVIPGGCDLYGISLFTTSYPEGLQIRDLIREKSTAPIVVGGPHASALPNETAKDFDYVFVGEAEHTFPQMIDRIISRKLPDKIIYSIAPINIDEVSLPNLEFIDLQRYSRIVDDKRGVSILASRGCHFKCTFCSTPLQFNNVRRRTPENIISEIQAFALRQPIHALRFIDDNFLVHARTLSELTSYIAHLGLPYRIYCRASDLNEQRCALLAATGCTMITCGIESGSQQIHELMRTKKDVNRQMGGLIVAKKHGIHIRANFIVGYPGETWETIHETANFFANAPIDSYNLFNFVPFPGTLPYERPHEFGITWLSKDWKDYYILCGKGDAGYPFRTKYLDKELIADMREYLNNSFQRSSIPSWMCEKFK